MNMIDLRTYVLETKKISSIDDKSSINDYVYEGFKLGKNKVKKDEDFVDLDLPSGTLWCKYNVGAKNGSIAKSWHGNYFMWGDVEIADNKICDWANYKYSNGSYDKLTKYCPTNKTTYWDGKGKPDNKLILDKEDDMAYANMEGEDWKIPTREQVQELIDNTTSEWITNYQEIYSLNGRLFTSKTNGNTLFIPAAGYRSSSSIYSAYSFIYVWSSTLDADDPNCGSCFVSSNKKMYIRCGSRSHGYPVRAVMN